MGGPDFACKEGTDGRLCRSCARQPQVYASMLGGCRKCNNDWRDWLMGIGGIILVASIWFTTNQAIADEMDALDMTLAFCQILSIVQGFHVNWHPKVETLTEIMTIVNFDVDYISPVLLLFLFLAFFQFYLPDTLYS